MQSLIVFSLHQKCPQGHKKLTWTLWGSSSWSPATHLRPSQGRLEDISPQPTTFQLAPSENSWDPSESQFPMCSPGTEITSLLFVP